MLEARLVWPPYPYRAGFCITDDTDAASLGSVRLVYDFLASLGLVSTKTVWAFKADQSCGIPATPPSTLRGVTLEDPDYLDYCRSLSGRGFEIALHGASAGNNSRDRTIAAFELIEREFGNSGTFICHAKNADNIYWEEKIAPDPVLRFALSRYSQHRCFGEDPDSPYFWGDVCRERVRQIRLFRTRETNTLAFNPSMPYFDATKPYVPGWFSATKRSFHDCCTETALEKICTDFGLTVLYQYLHRYADEAGGTVVSRFRTDAERLAAHPDVWVATTDNVMARLRAIQRLFVAYSDRFAYLVNTSEEDLNDVQIALSGDDEALLPSKDASQCRSRIHIARLPAGSVNRFELRMPVRFSGPRVKRATVGGQVSIPFDYGRCHLNVGKSPWARRRSAPVPGPGFELEFDEIYAGSQPISRAGPWEQRRMFLGQSAIILRELALRKRTLKYDRYLDADEIPLENHDNW